MVKIAFLFLAISQGSLEKAWDAFFQGHENVCSVYVHAKLYPRTLIAKRLKAVAQWDFLLQAEKKLLQEALNDATNDRFVFLSESTIPDCSFDEIYAEITQQTEPVFDYFPCKNRLPQRHAVIHWVVLDREQAGLMAAQSAWGYPQQLTLNEHYPSTFPNLLTTLKSNAQHLERKPRAVEVTSTIDEEPQVIEPEKREPDKIDLKRYAPDFDIAMGKYDLYLKPFFEKRLEHAPDFWQRSVTTDPPRVFFNFLKDLYNENKLGKVTPGDTYKIPPVFHQIWIGGKPFPEKYKKWQKTWQNLPGWKYKLWTDKEAEGFPLIHRELYLKEKNIGARADLLRLEILYREGGVYIDTDFECLQPEIFDIFNRSYDFYSGITPLDGHAYLIANGLIATAPGHPILKACIAYRKDIVVPDTPTGIVMKGPGFLTKMIYTYGNQPGYRDILFPPTFFYPLAVYPPKPKGPLSDKQGEFAHLMNSEAGHGK